MCCMCGCSDGTNTLTLANCLMVLKNRTLYRHDEGGGDRLDTIIPSHQNKHVRGPRGSWVAQTSNPQS